MKNTLMTVSFGIDEFNSLVQKDFKHKLFDSIEIINDQHHFMMLLNTLPKRIQQSWKSLEFTNQNGERIFVCKHWLNETGDDFENSHILLNNHDIN